MSSTNNLNSDQKVGFIFPGQGSQSLGMLGDMVDKHPIIKKTFGEASDALGYDLWQICQEGPESRLNSTEITQPALLTAGVALWRVWLQQNRPMPSFMAGHSLGEYTALVCASSLSLSDAVQVVAKRGALMQNAVPDGIGMMAAILGMSDSDVDTLCADTCIELGNNMLVASANYNTEGQVVISGHKPAVEKAMELAKTRGAKRAIALPVSVPSHCALMREASLDLAKILLLAPMKMPSIPVLHNIDGKACYTVDEIQAALVAQLYQPVQWVKTMRNMLSYGIQIFYECGPGNVLSGLNKQIDPSIVCESLSREAILCP